MRKTLCVLMCALCVGCQPPQPGQPQASAQAVALEGVRVQGSCAATVELDLRAGFLLLPVRAVISTEAKDGSTHGAAAVDVGGLLTAKCELAGGAAECAQGGLLLHAPAPKPEPTQDATATD